MRILHVLDHSLPLHSGYAFRSAAIINEQRRLGWTTAQVTGPKHPCNRLEEEVDGITYTRTRHSAKLLSHLPVLNQADVILALVRQLNRMASALRPQVIHAHSPCLNGLAAAQVARRQGIPYVYEMRASWEDAAVSHGTTTEGSLRYRLSRALETQVVRSADAVTTICDGLRLDIIGRGIGPDKVFVVPNAVDPEHFSGVLAPDAALKSRYCPDDAIVIGFIGSFYAYEGLDLLLAAVPDLVARCPRAHVLLVGGGPEERRLRELVGALGIAREVSFAGRIAQDGIPAMYGIMDLMVYPRRRNRLTDMVTPLKPLEAMAGHRLVTASDVGGHRELIVDRQTGFLFRPDDPVAMTATILAALETEAAAEIRQRGRDFVEENRTWPKVVAVYRAAYARALLAHSARGDRK